MRIREQKRGNIGKNTSNQQCNRRFAFFQYIGHQPNGILTDRCNGWGGQRMPIHTGAAMKFACLNQLPQKRSSLSGGHRNLRASGDFQNPQGIIGYILDRIVASHGCNGSNIPIWTGKSHDQGNGIIVPWVTVKNNGTFFIYHSRSSMYRLMVEELL